MSSNTRAPGVVALRTNEEAHQRQARIRQARMNAVTDGPDSGFAGQSGEHLHRIISHHVVKPAHQSLVRTEHDSANRPLIGSSLSFWHERYRRAFSETNAQS